MRYPLVCLNVAMRVAVREPGNNGQKRDCDAKADGDFLLDRRAPSFHCRLCFPHRPQALEREPRGRMQQESHQMSSAQAEQCQSESSWFWVPRPTGSMSTRFALLVEVVRTPGLHYGNWCLERAFEYYGSRIDTPMAQAVRAPAVPLGDAHAPLRADLDRKS